MAGSLEIAMNNIDQLLSGITLLFSMGSIGINQVRSDVIFQHDGQQAIHCASATGYLL